MGGLWWLVSRRSLVMVQVGLSLPDSGLAILFRSCELHCRLPGFVISFYLQWGLLVLTMSSNEGFRHANLGSSGQRVRRFNSPSSASLQKDYRAAWYIHPHSDIHSCITGICYPRKQRLAARQRTLRLWRRHLTDRFLLHDRGFVEHGCAVQF